MASSRNLQFTNFESKTSQSQKNNSPTTITNNQELNSRLKALEDKTNNQINEANAQIKQLQNKIQLLEKQVEQQNIQIKNLQEQVTDLQCHKSNENRAELITSSDIQRNITNIEFEINQHDEDEQPKLLSNKNSSNTLVVADDSQRQEIDRNFQMPKSEKNIKSKSEEIHEEKLRSLNIKDADSVKNILDIQNSNKINEEKHNNNINKSDKVADKTSSTTPKSSPAPSYCFRPRTSINNAHNVTKDRTEVLQKIASIGNQYQAFASWMDSRDQANSIWSNDNSRESLLNYIGKAYGRTRSQIKKLMDPLGIECNNSSELDQFHEIIKKFKQQPSAESSFDQCYVQRRPNRRFHELKSIFEYNSVDSLPTNDLRISPELFSEEIMNRDSIKGYFDLICRDGSITAQIGEYFNLSKENIFGGNDYKVHNERITFINVDLKKTIIELGDNRVDLITCLVTLHHVPNLGPMLFELVRILRPGGYLFLREHDCKNERSLTVKYLNFVHAFMMIARVGEFADVPVDVNRTHDSLNENNKRNTCDWQQQKSEIIEYTNSIQYRSFQEWESELNRVGLQHKATFRYDSSNDPQKLFYAIYQLNVK